MKPMTRKALIDPSWVIVGHDRGIQWVTDRFVLVRSDLLRTVPRHTAKGEHPRALRHILDGVRPYPRTPVSLDPKPYPRINNRGATWARLVRVGGHYIPVNARAWDEWTSRSWHSISATAHGVIVFHDLRRGKPVLAGVIMPMRLYGGDYTPTAP